MKFYAKNQSFMLFYAFSLFSKNVMIFYDFMPSGIPELTVISGEHKISCKEIQLIKQARNGNKILTSSVSMGKDS